MIQSAQHTLIASLSSGDPLTGPAVGTRDPQTAAREFAGLFYSMMLKEMHKSLPENPYFGTRAEGTFRSLWINEMGKALAAREGDALSAMILAVAARNGAGTRAQDSQGEPL